jgi:pyruvate formate lyase activating enzyme
VFEKFLLTWSKEYIKIKISLVVMGICNFCKKSAKTISNTIGFCVDCIRAHFDRVWPQIKTVHRHSLRAYGLPEDPPRADHGILCGRCVHNCRIPENGTGFCGLRRVKNGKIHGGRSHEGNLYFYLDPLPTNCAGDFVCPAGTGFGYPEYAVSKGPEYGYRNLAVFYHACAFNCLYCQNYHFKDHTFSTEKITAKALRFYLHDLPTTSRFHALRCLDAAQKAGLLMPDRKNNDASF